MNKLSLALGAGLALLTAAAPVAHAGAIDSTQATTPTGPQALPVQEMTAGQFNTLFTPLDNAGALSSPFQLVGTSNSGVVESQVFKGTGAADGYYAYAYQLGVSNVSTGDEPIQVKAASWNFNATPQGTNLLGQGTTYGYVIKDGTVGGLTAPSAPDGQMIQVPSTLSWQAGKTTGNLTAQYYDANTGASSLSAGNNGATFVVLTKQLFNTQYAGILSPDPQTGAPPSVYAPTGGPIEPIPIPEPTTLLAWAGLAGGLALARRVRRARAV